jgi:hypothetical protein
MVLSTSEPVPAELVEHLRQGDGIFGIHAVRLTP